MRLPAHPGFVGHVGSAVQATMALLERDLAAGTYLEEAVLALVDAMLVHARSWAPLETIRSA